MTVVWFYTKSRVYHLLRDCRTINKRTYASNYNPKPPERGRVIETGQYILGDNGRIYSDHRPCKVCC